MRPQELLMEIQKLPLRERRELLEALSRSISEHLESSKPISEDEAEHLLLEQGVIGNVPDPTSYTDEDEAFEPIEVTGKPISETIIEERR